MFRRAAQEFGGESREPYDEMLIRHIYDVHGVWGAMERRTDLV